MASFPILSSLNKSQQQAVLTTEGPVLVVAGAGSGKTRALTHRIAYLIQEKAVRPWNILAVTFTNKAAGEMRDRVQQLLGQQASAGVRGIEEDVNMPTIGTFHSVCVRILRKHIHHLDYENQFAIYDHSDQLILMKHIMKDRHIDEKQLNPRSVLAHISNAKNRLVSPERFAAMADSYFAEKVGHLYGPYQDGLKKNSALDFDDLLVKVVELFQKYPTILDQYQEKFRYIHVDEYQDTNYVQYLLTNMLAAKYRNICAIGDHDQSIYSWRGATIQNILDFEKDYPEAHVITMVQNYRSSPSILTAANGVIAHNRMRKKKALWTDRESGELVQLWIAENERHEGELVACAIRKTLKGYEFPDYRDFVALYRTNAQSRVLEEVFMRNGIPYKIIGGIRFYERKEIKDLLAYLRVIANHADTVSMMRIVNTPQRNIGPKTIQVLQHVSSVTGCTFFEAMERVDELSEELPDSKREHIKKFVNLIRRLQEYNRHYSASPLIKFTLDETGYKKFLDDGSIEGEARCENVAELISVATKYDKLEPGMSLNIFLEEVSLIADIDTLDEKDNSVTFMTLHAAKGLEFPHVFICGCEEGLLPHSQSMLDPAQLEEERRLFYVGCTRAMDRLCLLYTKNRLLYGETRSVIPSQFLSDIPKEVIVSNDKEAFEKLYGLGHGARVHVSQFNDMSTKPIPFEKPLLEFFDGDRVEHKKFGEGMVINATGGIITVAFKDPKVGIKKLALTIAPLRKI